MNTNFSFGGLNSNQQKTLPESLKGKTVEQAIEEFEKKLIEQEKNFKQSAQTIARRDRELFELTELYEELQKKVEAVQKKQDELLKEVQDLLDNQKSLLSNKPETGQSNSNSEVDELFTLVAEVESILEKNWTSYQPNKGSNKSETSDLDKLQTIVNNHYSAMKWIEVRSDSLEKRIEALEKIRK